MAHFTLLKQNLFIPVELSAPRIMCLNANQEKMSKKKAALASK